MEEGEMPFQPGEPTSDRGSGSVQSDADTCGHETGIGAMSFDRAELSGKLVTAFRLHSHINNVLTHISGTQWARIERALHTIMDPAITSEDLSPLEENLVELMWAERGVTGRILKPYLCEFIFRNLSRGAAAALLAHIANLCPLPPGAALRSADISTSGAEATTRSGFREPEES